MKNLLYKREEMSRRALSYKRCEHNTMRFLALRRAGCTVASAYHLSVLDNLSATTRSAPRAVADWLEALERRVQMLITSS